MITYLDGSQPEEGAKDYENMRLPMSECKGLADTEIGEIFDDYSFSLRWIRDDLLEDNPDYYVASKELYENLVAGTPTNAGSEDASSSAEAASSAAE